MSAQPERADAAIAAIAADTPEDIPEDIPEDFPAVPEDVPPLPEAPPEAPPEASWRRWLRALRPYPFELVTLASMLIAFSFLRYHGLRMDWAALGYIFRLPSRMMPKALLGGVLLHMAYRRLSGLPVKAYLREVARPRWWLLWVRLSLALTLVNYGYFFMKVSIPLINTRLWDEALWRFDTWLHFGISPSIFMVNLFAGTPLVLLTDYWYFLWIPTLFYTISFWNTGLDDRLRRRFSLSFVLLWTFGSWTYMSIPAMGPIYLTPQTFAEVTNDMPNAQNLQQALWDNYQVMQEGRKRGQLHAFNPTRGVASMPSLHVALHFFFFLWARRRARPLATAFALATFLTFLGSILTGWHYAVDGYAGMLLAWICYRIGCWGDWADPVGDPAFPRRGL